MTLNDLPDDITLYIFSLLDPVHVVVLRLTCRAFHALTSERSVWLNAFSTFSWRNQVHSNTFHPQHMSTTQLEDATTAPSRFIRKLLSGNSLEGSELRPTIQPASIRMLSLHGSNPFRITFILGGRFLLVESLSQDTSADQVFTLLDLDSTKRDCQVLSEWSCPGPNWACVPLPSNYDRKFKFVISPLKYLVSDLSIFYVVGETSRSAEEEGSVVMKLRRYTLPSSKIIQQPGLRLRSYKLVEDLFIFDYKDANDDQHIVAWKYAADKAVVWEIVQHPLKSPITIHNGHIAIIVGRSLRGWKIPDFSTVQRGTTLRIENPPLAFNTEFMSYHSRLLCRGSATWYGSESPYGTQIFDMVHVTAQLFNHAAPRHHSLLAWSFFDPPVQREASITDQLHSCNSEPHPSVSYRATSNVPTMLKNEREEPKRVQALSFAIPFTICEDHIIRILQNEDGEVYAHTTPLVSGVTNEDEAGVENSEAKPPEGVVVNLAVTWDPQIHSYIDKPSFDPVSGRLAYMTPEEGLIVVVDYNSRRSDSN